MSNQNSNSKPWYEKVSTQMAPTTLRQTSDDRYNSGRSQRNNHNKNYDNSNSNSNSNNRSKPRNYSEEQSRNERSGPSAKRTPSDFWNIKAIDYLVQELKAEPQIPFKPANQNADQIVVDSQGQTVQSGKQLPDHLLDLGVPKEYLGKTIIYQVDTNYSAWHSILALIHPEYGVLDYDCKRVMVMRLRDVVNNDFINNPGLRDKIVKHGLRLVHVENSINQDKIQDEILLRFFSLYFDANIYLVTEDSCYVFHEGQTFSGKLMDAITVSENLVNGASQISYNPYKSSFLLYRFPYGNVAPVVQEGRTSQILSSSTDEVFFMAMAKNLSASVPTQAKETETVPVNNLEALKAESSKTHSRKTESKENQKEKFVSTLLKLKWEELAEIAEKEQIKPLQPSVKGYDGWKKKTKAQLAEELWQATEANA